MQMRGIRADVTAVVAVIHSGRHHSCMASHYLLPHSMMLHKPGTHWCRSRADQCPTCSTLSVQATARACPPEAHLRKRAAHLPEVHQQAGRARPPENPQPRSDRELGQQHAGSGERPDDGASRRSRRLPPGPPLSSGAAREVLPAQHMQEVDLLICRVLMSCATSPTAFQFMLQLRTLHQKLCYGVHGATPAALCLGQAAACAGVTEQPAARAGKSGSISVCWLAAPGAVASPADGIWQRAAVSAITATEGGSIGCWQTPDSDGTAVLWGLCIRQPPDRPDTAASGVKPWLEAVMELPVEAVTPHGRSGRPLRSG